jgi:transposase-like protein
VFAALAEFIRELVIEGTNEGLAAARGQKLGRPPAMTPEQIRHARALLTQPDATIASIARLLGVSRSTIYKYIPELKTGSDHQAIEVPTARRSSHPRARDSWPRRAGRTGWRLIRTGTRDSLVSSSWRLTAPPCQVPTKVPKGMGRRPCPRSLLARTIES